ncbi:MAG TPA: ABC transporter permease [Microlunatus sp.]
MSAGLAGTGSLIRLALRRDRVVLPVSIVIFTAIAVGSAQASIAVFPTVQSRITAAESVNHAPALVAMYGRVYDPTSLGAVSMIKMIALYVLFLAVLGIFTVTRHTRAEEETGRLELLGAAVVGRYATLTAALAVSFGVMVTIGLLVGAGLITVGLPVGGSLAFGLMWIGVGCCYAAVAAVATQITDSARASNGLAAGTMALAFVLRAIGDTSGPGWFSWLSPSGWGVQVRPFAGDRWWVLLLPLGFTAVASTAAYQLAARRDLGSGLLQAHPGPKHAARWLRTPFGLAWRLQRGALLGWTIGFAVGGLFAGNIAADIGTMMSGNDQLGELLQSMGGVAGLTDAYFVAMLGILSVLASAYGVQAALRLRSEEASQRAEPLLATPVQRSAWMLGHLTIAFAGTAWLIMIAGITAGLAHGVQTDDLTRAFGRVVEGALVQIPAIWVLVGLVAALFGVLPRWSSSAWVFLVFFLLLGEFGALFKLNQMIMDLSPYAHVPRLPGGQFSLPPLAWLTALTVVLTGIGILAFRHRDLRSA